MDIVDNLLGQEICDFFQSLQAFPH
jgi:hypothetical protein